MRGKFNVEAIILKPGKCWWTRGEQTL